MLQATTSHGEWQTKVDGVAVAGRAGRHENWVKWLLGHWGEVGVVDGVWSLEWVAGRPRLHAEVCIVLGALQPADVRVELLPLEPLPDEHPLARGRALEPMARLRHERYWFALNARAEPDDSARRWIVRVRPARPLGRSGDAPPVDVELDAVPAGTPRRRLRQHEPHSRLRPEEVRA